ncbi:MAG TPA: hypothetical protein VGF45_06120, partial [Polyangia bacterium]
MIRSRVRRKAQDFVHGLVFLTVVGSAGCEHGFTLRGTVTVPAAVQAHFSAAAPGVVVMGGGNGGASVAPELLAVLCAPGNGDLTIPLLYDRLGCAHEGTVWVAALPLGKTADGAPACGIRQESYAALLNRKAVPPLDDEQVVARAAVTV